MSIFKGIVTKGTALLFRMNSEIEKIVADTRKLLFFMFVAGFSTFILDFIFEYTLEFILPDPLGEILAETLLLVVVVLFVKSVLKRHTTKNKRIFIFAKMAACAYVGQILLALTIFGFTYDSYPALISAAGEKNGHWTAKVTPVNLTCEPSDKEVSVGHIANDNRWFFPFVTWVDSGTVMLEMEDAAAKNEIVIISEVGMRLNIFSWYINTLNAELTGTICE